MNHKRKFLLLVTVCAVLTFVCFVTAKDNHIADQDLIRFHVIANSDTTFDQGVKLQVRNSVIDEVNALLVDVKSANEAKEILACNSDEIKATADAVLQADGCNYQAEVKLGTSRFPTKSYGDLTLPAGKYNALRIVLGQGEGKNWWCVLYPPLCFVDINDDTAIAVTTTNPQLNDVKIVPAGSTPAKIQVKSKFLEWLKK